MTPERMERLIQVLRDDVRSLQAEILKLWELVH